MPSELHCFQASSAGIIDAVQAFDAFGRGHGLAREIISATQIALDEILSNTVKSNPASAARGSEEQTTISVSFAVTTGVLEVVIRDKGRPFDPLARPDPDTKAPLEDRPVGGLGIYLVKNLMDGVEYQRVDGENMLRMTKRIDH